MNKTAHRSTTIWIVAALAAAVTVGALGAASAVTGQAPEVALSCVMDSCIVRASYLLPVRRDDHRVTVRFETVPAAGYAENAADLVVRSLPAGIGEVVHREGAPPAYRYTVSDVVWHSDIRCDQSVRVTVTTANVTGERTVPKEIPVRAGAAHCSQYGVR